MKKIIVLLLALCLLAGCGAAAPEPSTEAATVPQTELQTEPVTEPPTEPTTEPTTEPPPVYTNPLTGELLDGPFDGRIYAVTVANIPESLPHVGVTQADVLMEMYVNHSIIRCLALYTQPEKAATVGSVRSTRLMFNDIAQHYDAVLFHAGGSGQVLTDAADRGLDHFNLDSWVVEEAGASQRDRLRNSQIGWEHCLVAIGPELRNYAESQGVSVTTEPDRDYGLLFTPDGTPSEGEAAETITVKLVYGRSSKETILEYDPEAGKYHYGGIFYQRKIMHTDHVTKEPELFENVVILHADISLNGIYHTADFVSGGTGYYACNGRIMPMVWSCGGEDQPLRFFHPDGTPLLFGEGNTYMAIASPDSPVTWTAPEPAPEGAEETVEEAAG